MKRLSELGQHDPYFNLKGARIGDKYEEGFKISLFAYILIIKYIGFFSLNINSWLRSTPKGDDDFTLFFEYLMNKALKELPPYNNQIVFRMDSPGIEFDVLKIWYSKRIGEVISFPNFLSTSKYRWNTSHIFFKIHTSQKSQARDVQYISDKPKEKELIFLSRSKFRIIGVNDEKENQFIELQEVDRIHNDVINMDSCVYINDKEIEKLLGLDDRNDDDYIPSFIERGLI